MIKNFLGLIIMIALISTNGVTAQEMTDSTVKDTVSIGSDEPPVLVDYDEGIMDAIVEDIDVLGYPLNLRDEDLSSFMILDSIADRSRFIFTGEDHRVEKLNTTLELRMMTYLHTRGYRYYLIEAGFASEWLINKYIVEQDSAAGVALKNYYNTNFYNMFDGMKLINDTMPKENRIRTVALDIERDVPLALKMLWMLLPEKQVSDSLEMFTESLKMIAAIQEAQGKEGKENETDDEKDLFDFGGFEYDMYAEEEYVYQEERYFYFKLIPSVTDLTQRFRNNSEEFKSLLGNDYELFEQVIKELENWLIWISYEQQQMPQSWVFREQYMEKKFRAFFEPKPEAKAFGQFGRCHVTRVTKVGDCGFAFFSSLNKRLISKMPDLTGKVVSIGIFYPGLEYRSDYRDNGEIATLIDQTEKGTAMLFLDIKDLGSPELSDKFSHIIIAKSSNEGINFDGDDFTRKSNSRFGMEVNFGTKQFNFDDLNKQVNMNHSGQLSFWEIGYDIRDNRWHNRSTFRFFGANSTNLGDSAVIGLKGWEFHSLHGFDILKARWIDLVPMFGIGYQNLEYSETRKDIGPTYFGSEVLTKYHNPAFIFDARIELMINMGFFSIKTFAGYDIDVSRKSWKQGGNIIKTSPNTSLSGYYYGFGFAFTGEMF